MDPLAAPSVSTTVRLPVELAEYLGRLVASGQARDKTDAVVRCIRRHQVTQAGVSDLGRLEAGQADLMARLGEVTDQLQGMRDDLVMVSSRSGDGLAGLQQSIAALLSAGLYAQAESGPPEAAGETGGGPAVLLPVKLMDAPAPTRRNKP
ncbi:hypothetical protein [Roseateles sp. MS654]|uniref:hypothetical protein n=1 Tax=Roseateles sp. MS654 TaxID=3412685 RepID=UPI003C2BE66F